MAMQENNVSVLLVICQ